MLNISDLRQAFKNKFEDNIIYTRHIVSYVQCVAPTFSNDNFPLPLHVSFLLLLSQTGIFLLSLLLQMFCMINIFNGLDTCDTRNIDMWCA